ncbi:hypothetical protein OHS58_40845 [Amycolatopsis sp. NBC_00348]
MSGWSWTAASSTAGTQAERLDADLDVDGGRPGGIWLRGRADR